MDILDIMIDKDWKIKNSNQFHGFWANTWSASRCDYHAIGRGSDYRYHNETQRRANIDKLLDPSRQKKLYIIDMDIKNRFSAPLIGYMHLNDIGSHIHFVAAPYSEKSKQQLQELIEHGFYDKSEIVRLKASEMTEEVEKYDSMRPKVEREPSEDDDRVRPKSPNVVRWFRDEDGTMEQENLYLSKNDFLSLKEEHAIRAYGYDDGYPLKREDNSAHMDINLVASGNSSRASIYCKALGVKSFLMLRNSVWNWIDQSNLVCLDDALHDALVNSLKRLKPNTLSCVTGSKHKDKIRTLHKEYDVLLTPLVKNRYNAKDCQVVDLLIPRILRAHDMDPKSPKLVPLVKKYIEMKGEMRIRCDAAYEKFKELNPFLEAIVAAVANDWSVRRKLAGNTKTNDFTQLIRWK